MNNHTTFATPATPATPTIPTTINLNNHHQPTSTRPATPATIEGASTTAPLQRPTMLQLLLYSLGVQQEGKESVVPGGGDDDDDDDGDDDENNENNNDNDDDYDGQNEADFMVVTMVTAIP